MSGRSWSKSFQERAAERREALVHKVCATCEFWAGRAMFERYDGGKCVRFPPTRFGDGGHLQHSPVMRAHNSCGEWRHMTSGSEDRR